MVFGTTNLGKHTIRTGQREIKLLIYSEQDSKGAILQAWAPPKTDKRQARKSIMKQSQGGKTWQRSFLLLASRTSRKEFFPLPVRWRQCRRGSNSPKYTQFSLPVSTVIAVSQNPCFQGLSGPRSVPFISRKFRDPRAPGRLPLFHLALRLCSMARTAFRTWRKRSFFSFPHLICDKTGLIVLTHRCWRR